MANVSKSCKVVCNMRRNASLFNGVKCLKFETCLNVTF